jgi:hypothetical protein
MPKATKKPVEIDYCVWNGDNLFEIITFTGGKPDLKSSTSRSKWEDYCDLVKRAGFKIKTLEGWMDANIGDYIIKGVKGEFYPCKPDIFKLTYDEAGE